MTNQTIHNLPFVKHNDIRVGFIGAGGRGRSLMHDVLACPGVQLCAIADVAEAAIAQAIHQITQTNQPAPKTFVGIEGWRRLLDENLDIVYIATPWDTHTPYAVAAMQAGKHAAVEVPAATTLEECWQLVEASERTRQHCVMLENCCYGYWEMLVKRMARAGIFGTLTHAECAYIHDLRSLLLSDHSEGLWRREPHKTRNGNFYPTHGLGPVAQCLGMGGAGDGDEFEYLVSLSSREAALTEFRDAHTPSKRNEVYKAGDMNVSLIKTKQGRSIVLQHDVVTPRPYDRIFLIAGTRGIFRDYPPRLYLDGVGQPHEWLPLDRYQAVWEDPLWRTHGDEARQHGHGGMDFIMSYRLMQCMREGLPPDMDVYDAAEWSAPGPLSEQSVAGRSVPVAFPDFRRGM
jgi:predicted dehydrogenase